MMLLLGVLVPRRAAGAEAEVDWSQTFTPTSIAQYLEEGRGQILVVAASSDRQTGRVGLVLQTAMRASNKAEQVMDGERLGDVHLLDDQAIVQRAAQLPINNIAIVRLLAAQDAPAVTVNFYTPQGELRLSLSARAGEHLAAPSSDFAAGGLTGAGTPGTSSALRLAQAEYDVQYIGFIGMGPADGSVTHTSLRSLDAYEGQEQRRLSPTEFYRKLGRPQLAETYEKRRSNALGLIAAGGVLFGLSTSVVIGTSTALATNVTTNVTTNGMNSTSTQAGFVSGVVIGSALTISAIVTAAVGTVRYLDRHPIPSSEALRLADQYNRSLRRRLGLQPAVASLLRSLQLQAGTSATGVSFRGLF